MVSRLPYSLLAPCPLICVLTCAAFVFCADYFPGYSVFTTQTIEAHREARRQAGAEVAPDASRSLEEQLLAVQA